MIRRTIAAAAAVTVSALLLSTSAADASTHLPSRTAHATSPTRVLPRAATVAPSATAAQINTWLATVPADGGTSVLLPDGRALWLFGDTLDGTGRRNSAQTQSGSTFTPRAGEMLARSGDGQTWYWPGQPVIDGGKVVILFAEMHADGGWGTQQAIVTAKYNASTLALLSTARQAGTTAWGVGVVKAASKWQIFGTQDIGDGTHRKALYVRTAPLGSLATPSTWTAPVKVLDETWGAQDLGVGTAVSVIQSGTGLLLATKYGDLYSNDIVTATAPKATGPWTAPKVVASPTYPGAWTYAAALHPEQQHAAGKQTLTYAVNGDHLDPAFHLYATTVTAP